MKTAKVIAYMPIKTNNLRCPGKNTKYLGNKPLLLHVLSTAAQVAEIDDLYVFCSDESIKGFLPSGVKFLKRSKNLDGETTLGNEIYSSFVNLVDADVYVLLHATSPFLRSETIQKAIESVTRDGYDSSTTVVAHRTFAWCYDKPVNYDISNPPRTQDIEPVLLETSALYCYSKKHWNERRARLGGRIKFLETSFKEAIDIDTERDFETAEQYV